MEDRSCKWFLTLPYFDDVKGEDGLSSRKGDGAQLAKTRNRLKKSTKNHRSLFPKS